MAVPREYIDLLRRAAAFKKGLRDFSNVFDAVWRDQPGYFETI